MPLFTNIVPLDAPSEEKSREAGQTLTEALAQAIEALRGYETPVEGEAYARLGHLEQVADRFSDASDRYRELYDIVRDDSIRLPGSVRDAFMAAFGFWQSTGGLLLWESMRSPAVAEVEVGTTSSKALVELAERGAAEMADRLRKLRGDPKDAETGRRVAADIAVMQMLGLASTNAMQGAVPRR